MMAVVVKERISKDCGWLMRPEPVKAGGHTHSCLLWALDQATGQTKTGKHPAKGGRHGQH